MTNATTTVTLGTKTATIIVTGARDWTGGENVRRYFDLKITGKGNPLAGMYEVVKGATRDNTVSVNGRTFAYQYGHADSNTKRRAVDAAVAELAEQLAA
jgi:hypothetical protein